MSNNDVEIHNEMALNAPPADEFLDLESCFRPVAAQHGRMMFAFVHNAGMAGQAAEVLGALVAKHHSQHSAHALGVLVSAFNQASNAMARKEGWTAEMIAHCERDIQLAFRGKIITPASQLILDS